MYNSNADPTILKNELQCDLDTIFQISATNKLFINLSKTESMTFQFHRNTQNLEFTINKNPIKSVTNFKYLGLIIDSKLTFREHILETTKKLNSVNRIIYVLSHFLPSFILRKIFMSVGFPHTNLHITAWGGANKTNLHPLNIVLNKIVRNLRNNCNLIHIDTSEAYKTLNILSIQKLYHLRISEFLYNAKSGNNYILQDFASTFEWKHQYNTRRSQPFQMPLIQSNITKSFFLINSFKYWPIIPKEIIDSSSLPIFKSSLKQYLFKS